MPRNSLQQTKSHAMPRSDSSADLLPSTKIRATPIGSSLTVPLPGDHSEIGAQRKRVAGSTLPRTNDESVPRVHPSAEPSSEPDHVSSETHQSAVRFGTDSPTPIVEPISNAAAASGPLLFNWYLGMLADSLDDIERLRIATENRVRQMTRGTCEHCKSEDHDQCTDKNAEKVHADGECKCGIDKDGEERGLGLNQLSPEVARMQGIVDGISALEHSATLDLKRELRRTPFAAWVKTHKGIGEKQTARLLATIGDPYWNDLHDRPRTVSELWAYCGYAVHGGRADARTKGQLSNWSNAAKMRTFVMAESCVKATGGEYRAVYDDARAKYADAVHPHDCRQCGTPGHPAPVGTPLRPGHQHARALRVVSKTILRDLWIVARDNHQQTEPPLR